MKTETGAGCLDILVAEDDPDDLQLLLKALHRMATSAQLRVRVARDGIALCEMIEALPTCESPLILLDLNLPRLDGREVLAWLQKRQIKIPTIVLSTSDAHEDRDRCLQLGAVEILRKPDDFRSLVSVMQAVVDRYLAGTGKVGP